MNSSYSRIIIATASRSSRHTFAADIDADPLDLPP